MTDKEQPKVPLEGDVEPEVTEEEITEILKKVDKESTFRRLIGYQHWIVYAIAVAFSLFQLYTGVFGFLPAQKQRSIHLAFAFVLVFLLYPFRTRSGSNKLKWLDYLFAVFAGYVGLYLSLNYVRIMEAGGDYMTMDYIVGILGTFLTLEAARRAVGLPIVCIASAFLLYSYFGAYFPGFLAHRGFSIRRIVAHMYFTTEGILEFPWVFRPRLFFSSFFLELFWKRRGSGSSSLISQTRSQDGPRAGPPRLLSSRVLSRGRFRGVRSRTRWVLEALRFQ